jgi:hypothetical protein
MRKYRFALALIVPTCLIAAGCTENRVVGDRLPPPVPAATPTSSTTVPQGSPSPDSGRATTVPPDPERNPSSSTGAGVPPTPDKDKPRGNTPPGMDRTGGGPADGAIRDPAGAVTKQPEPKAPVQ